LWSVELFRALWYVGILFIPEARDTFAIVKCQVFPCPHSRADILDLSGGVFLACFGANSFDRL